MPVRSDSSDTPADGPRNSDELEAAYAERYRELAETNERLKELNRFKDEVIAVCSHDLRAPLQVLIGHSHLLLEAELRPDERVSAEAILRQGKKILALVESLLEGGRGRQTRVPLETRRLDVARLCREAASELSILASARSLSLEVSTSEALPVFGDELKLRQVLQNLVTHGIRRAKEGGGVRLRAERLQRPDGDACKVVVEDDGPPLQPGELPLAFDRYWHDPSAGAGFGLAICRELVERHGGEIGVENLPQGGTAFSFTLPHLP